MIALETLTPCFQGLIPATFYTCSKDGIPNVAYLSHIDYVDARHVALSFQFFNKSRRNIAENPHARVRVHDPDDMQCYEFTVRYVRSERRRRARRVNSGSAPRSAARPGTGGSRAPGSATRTSSTSYTSAAKSLKMPFKPKIDAIASMRRNMESKSGPEVSERT